MKSASGRLPAEATRERGADVLRVPPPLYFGAALGAGMLLREIAMPLAIAGGQATGVVGGVVLGAGAALGRSLARWQAVRADIAAVEVSIEALLGETAGQVLTTLPGVAVIRAASFAAFSLPVDRFPTAEHLYSATGLAPARYQSATINRTGRISRTGLAEHRDALMGIAWGLSQRCAPFVDRDRELRARGMAAIQARVALAATPADRPTGC